MARFTDLFRGARAAISGYIASRRTGSRSSAPIVNRSGKIELPSQAAFEAYWRSIPNLPGNPPIQSSPVVRAITGNALAKEEFDDLELLGRDASYDREEWERLQASQIRVVKSSNVYSYVYEPETNSKGILFVTFLDWEPGMKAEDRSGPGPTYAYYDFPLAKYNQFAEMAASSAGSAVWDYCRVRQTVHEHQHRYRLIQVSGDYVPRKATARGFKGRTLVAPGRGPLERKGVFQRPGLQRLTLPHRQAFRRSTKPDVNRGVPNRGAPNRGN